MEEISFIRSGDVEEIKATDCIIKVHITSGNIKWRSFALRFCASNPKSAWQPLLPSAKGLSFTFTFYHYTRVMVIFTFPFYTLSFGKHYVLERSGYIYIHWDVGFIKYYCLHYPWGKRLGGETISPYLSLCPLKLWTHKYRVSVSNCERLNDSWVCGLAEKLLYWLFLML